MNARTQRPADATRESRRAQLAALQHRLRTPASAIVGYTRMLLEEAPPQYHEQLQRVRSAAETLVQLIEDRVLVDHKDGVHLDRDFAEFSQLLRRELGTPMHVILGFCDLLVDNMREQGSKLATDVARIVEATQRLLQLLEDTDEPETGTLVAASRATLPKAQSAEAIARGAAADLAMAALADSTVLVVDDDEMNRTLLTRYLQRSKFNVLTANDGVEALKVLHAEAVDLVLLDVVMPLMDGFAVLEEMRKDAVLVNVPVIVISALDDLASAVRCIELGAQEYLPKTFNRTLFDARVRAVLERKQLHDRAQRYNEELQIERERSERLLADILPAPIAERLKLGETTIADGFDCVTIVFLDIVGFTPWSARIEPKALVSRLNDLFRQFDDLVEEHGVEKLKTMGDSYMLVSGLPRPRDDHALLAASASIAMMRAVEEHNQRYEESIQLRCGMHSGPVVAGVIGRHRFSYDVWGDSVNVASRMESNGVPGAIQVSAATAALLEGSFSLTSRGEIAVQGKGKMHTYLLEM